MGRYCCYLLPRQDDGTPKTQVNGRFSQTRWVTLYWPLDALQIVVYAYTGTWLADFPMNHYTHWIGLLLKPSKEEVDKMREEAMEGQGEKEESHTNGF